MAIRFFCAISEIFLSRFEKVTGPNLEKLPKTPQKHTFWVRAHPKMIRRTPSSSMLPERMVGWIETTSGMSHRIFKKIFLGFWTFPDSWLFNTNRQTVPRRWSQIVLVTSINLIEEVHTLILSYRTCFSDKNWKSCTFGSFPSIAKWRKIAILKHKSQNRSEKHREHRLDHEYQLVSGRSYAPLAMSGVFFRSKLIDSDPRIYSIFPLFRENRRFSTQIAKPLREASRKSLRSS